MTKQSGAGSTILIIVLALLALGALGWAVYNQSLVDNLKRELANAQDQLTQVNQETEEARQELMGEAQEGLQEVGQAIQGVESVPVRLALFKAYVNRLKVVLTPEAKADLDKIVVYIEKQPVVLIQKPAQLPAEIQTAVDNIKTEVQTAKVMAVASTEMKQMAGTPTPAAGKTVILTGVLAEEPADAVLEGKVYSLVDKNDGQTYYFKFSEANSLTVDKMVGQEVKITVKTTGTTAEGMVTYEVVSGPTLVSSVTPTVKPTIAAEGE